MSTNNTTPQTKNPKSSLILVGVVASIALIICACLIMGLFFNSSNKNKAKVLSAEEVFEVSAIDVVKDDGYTVTSAVCEVVSSERFQPSVNVDGGQIVFHAFRITKPSLGTEVA